MSVIPKIHLIKIKSDAVNKVCKDECYCGKLMPGKSTTMKFYKTNCDKCLEAYKAEKTLSAVTTI